MTLTDSDLDSVVATAIGEAVQDVAKEGRATERSKLSKRFVPRLGQQLMDLDAKTKADSSLQGWFLDKSGLREPMGSGRGEFLWDIFIAMTDGNGDGTARIRKGVWAVESELSNSIRGLQRDFNKLVVARVENRLFVMPKLSNKGKLCQLLDGFRAQCADQERWIWIALVPPLKNWLELGQSSATVRVLRTDQLSQDK